MITLILFAVVCNLDFLLVDGRQNNNIEWKSKFKPRKYESDLPRTQDGRIVEQLVEILKNPDIVKSLLVPKDMGVLFDIVDQAIPGAKELKNPIEETMHHLIPILKVSILPTKPKAF